jgi:hypothetical protein
MKIQTLQSVSKSYKSKRVKKKKMKQNTLRTQNPSKAQFKTQKGKRQKVMP